MKNLSILEAARGARKASIEMASIQGSVKNNALKAVAALLNEKKEEIFKANSMDIQAAKESGVASPLLKRLKFDQAKLDGVLDGINTLTSLDDPSGMIKLAIQLDTGLDLYRVSCPIGVIGMIFESRPDALVQISTLCLKSGNAVLLKGGKEAFETNRILTRIIAEATAREGIPSNWIFNVETREEVAEMLAMDNEIDLLIPRGSNEFVRYIMDNSRIPVMGHADGICHTYIHKDADVDMAVSVAVDSKAQYVAVCNATETILMDADVAEKILPPLVHSLQGSGVHVKGCEKTRSIVDGLDSAAGEDWATEYLDMIVSIRIVNSMDDAIEHINRYGSGHTDAIITEDRSAAEFFMNRVDSANVFHNCSTRFSDGFRYGFGAEVGISTGKLHARGPVGLEGLMTYKYKLYGHGQIVADYASGKRKFTHKPIGKD